MTTDLTHASARDLLTLYRSKATSPVEAAKAVLARIERLQPYYNAYRALGADSALAQARGFAGRRQDHSRHGQHQAGALLSRYSRPRIADRDRLMMLGHDLAKAWDSVGATPETRKKIIRTVISEIIVDVVDDCLDLIIHWQGGDHTRLQVKKNKFGHTRWVTDDNIVDLVTALARHMPDHAIAMVLNRSGKKTSHGHSCTPANSIAKTWRKRGMTGKTCSRRLIRTGLYSLMKPAQTRK